MFTLLARHSVAADRVTTSETASRWRWTLLHATSGWRTIRANHVIIYRALSHCRVEVETGLALVTLVGISSRRHPAYLKMFCRLKNTRYAGLPRRIQ